jgi:hypothetical protein
VQHDPFSTYETYADMQALQRNMTHLQNTLMPSVTAEPASLAPQWPSPAQLQQPKQQLESVVQELERLSSFAEHIASGEKLNDVAQLSNKLLDQQNKLLAALDNLPKDFQGGNVPPELQKLLDSLQSLMQDLMQAMAQLPMTLPDEFLNRQLDTFPLSDMMRQLQEMKQKLEAGDLDGAQADGRATPQKPVGDGGRSAEYAAAGARRVARRHEPAIDGVVETS